MCVVSQGKDVVDHSQSHRRLDLVSPVVAVLSSHAGSGLSLFEVLFKSQADGVGILNVVFPVLVDETYVVIGESDVQVPHLDGFVTNQLGYILARGGTGGLQVACPVHAGVELFHHGLMFVVVFLHSRGADAGGPFGVGAVLYLLAKQGILPAVEIDVFTDHGDAGDRFQFLGYRNLHRFHAGLSTWPDDNMSYL